MRAASRLRNWLGAVDAKRGFALEPPKFTICQSPHSEQHLFFAGLGDSVLSRLAKSATDEHFGECLRWNKGLAQSVHHDPGSIHDHGMPLN